MGGDPSGARPSGGWLLGVLVTVGVVIALPLLWGGAPRSLPAPAGTPTDARGRAPDPASGPGLPGQAHAVEVVREIEFLVRDALTGRPVSGAAGAMDGAPIDGRSDDAGVLRLSLPPSVSGDAQLLVEAPLYEAATVRLGEAPERADAAWPRTVLLAPLVVFHGQVVTVDGSPARDAEVVLARRGPGPDVHLARTMTDEEGLFRLQVPRRQLPVLAGDRRLVARSTTGLLGVVERPWPATPHRIELMAHSGTLTVRLATEQRPADEDTHLVVVRDGVTTKTKALPTELVFPVTVPAGATSATIHLPHGLYSLEPVDPVEGGALVAGTASLQGTSAELVVRRIDTWFLDVRVRSQSTGSAIPGAEVALDLGMHRRTDAQGRARLWLHAGPADPRSHRTLEVSHPQFVTRLVEVGVQPRSGTQEVAIELDDQDLQGELRVRVISPTGAEVHGCAFLAVFDTRPALHPRTWPSARPGITDVVDVDGTGVRSGLPEGSTLRVDPPADAGLGRVVVSLERVRRARDAGEVLVIELAAREPRALQLLAPDDVPWSGIEVVAWTGDVPYDPIARPDVACREADSAAITDGDGACTLSVPRGREVLLAAFDAAGLLAWHHAPAAPSEPMRWVIRPRGTLAGRCELPTGDGVAAKFNLMPADLPAGLAAALRLQLQAAPDGRFSVSVPTGAWQLFAYLRVGDAQYQGAVHLDVPHPGAPPTVLLEPED